MIVNKTDIRAAGNVMLLDVPRSAITGIICGARAVDETKAKLSDIAQQIGCKYLEVRIGRSSSVPFMVDKRATPFGFSDGKIGELDYYCEECQEPTSEDVFRCSWCDIDDEVRRNAAMSNSFRILHHYGLLESYIEGASMIQPTPPKADSE